MGYKTYSCPIASKCGGCEWLNVPYPIQLDRKQADIERLFEKLCDPSLVYRILGMHDPTRCRNKVIVPFGRGKGGKNGNLVYGLYSKGSHRIVQKSDCLVEHGAAASILKTVANLARSFKLKPFDEKTGSGFLRYALLRIGEKTGEVLLCLVCASDDFKGSKAFVSQLRKKHPQISTVVINVNRRSTNVVLGERERVLYGKGWIEDELLGCRFRVSSQSFFQVNPRQTEVLYSKAIEMAGLEGSSRVLDAYCGTGTIGIIASKMTARRVVDSHGGDTLGGGDGSKADGGAAKTAIDLVGVESNAAAIRDAKANARRNKVDDACFVVADAGNFMRSCAEDGDRFDAVLLDPPRAGCDERFLKSLAVLSPEKIVYISCNPATQARDCAFMLKNGYFVKMVQPVDMFPHTKHLENIALLMRRDESE